MKKIYLILLTAFFACTKVTAQNIGIGTDMPDSSALLEIKSQSKGLLPPRVMLLATNNPSPIKKPAQGLLVYNLVSAGSSPTNVHPGYYYWDGNQWVSLDTKGNNYGDMQYWDGSKWMIVSPGLNGQTLTMVNGVPAWANCSCSGGTKVLILQPQNNTYELNFTNYNPNQLASGGGTQMAIQAWTALGNSLITREIIKFDYSSLGSGITIDSAKLFLYATDNPVGGNTVDAHYGNNNACSIQRITSSWSLPCPYSWNNLPSVTTVNEAIIPQSLSSTDDNEIVITNLVKDMLTNGNNGFQIKLQNEVTYNIRQYVSSYSSNTLKRPKLIIYYH
jgi:hypothetical protein